MFFTIFSSVFRFCKCYSRKCSLTDIYDVQKLMLEQGRVAAELETAILAHNFSIEQIQHEPGPLEILLKDLLKTNLEKTQLKVILYDERLRYEKALRSNKLTSEAKERLKGLEKHFDRLERRFNQERTRFNFLKKKMKQELRMVEAQELASKELELYKLNMADFKSTGEIRFKLSASFVFKRFNQLEKTAHKESEELQVLFDQKFFPTRKKKSVSFSKEIIDKEIEKEKLKDQENQTVSRASTSVDKINI